jgi:hypothetical protein
MVHLPFGDAIVQPLVDYFVNNVPGGGVVAGPSRELSSYMAEVDFDSVLVIAEGEARVAVSGTDGGRSDSLPADIDALASQLADHPQYDGRTVITKARDVFNSVFMPPFYCPEPLHSKEISGRRLIELGMLTFANKDEVLGFVPCLLPQRVQPSGRTRRCLLAHNMSQFPQGNFDSR